MLGICGECRSLLERDPVQARGEFLAQPPGDAAALVGQTLRAELPLLGDHAQAERHQHDAGKDDGNEKEQELPPMPVCSHGSPELEVAYSLILEAGAVVMQMSWKGLPIRGSTGRPMRGRPRPPTGGHRNLTR